MRARQQQKEEGYKVGTFLLVLIILALSHTAAYAQGFNDGCKEMAELVKANDDFLERLRKKLDDIAENKEVRHDK